MPSHQTKALLALTTVSKRSDATKISKVLVEQGLAACVTTLPQGESRYHWQGKLCVEKEFVLLIKTLPGKFDQLKNTLEKIHPYDCPEILGIPIEKVSTPYLNWLKQNIAKKK